MTKLLQRCVAAAALIAATITGIAQPAGAAPSRVPPDTFGINGNGLYDLGRPARRLQAQRIAEQGITFVRREATWYSIEPEAPQLNLWTLKQTHEYRWDEGTAARRGSGFDGFVYDLASAGLRWQPVLGFSPRWASRNSWDAQNFMFYPPYNNDDFGEFAAAFAARYGRNGTFWRAHPELDASLYVKVYEIWNEPNLGGNWRPKPDPAAYGALWKTAHFFMSRTDPAFADQAVIVGSLGAAPENWLHADGTYDYRDIDFVHEMFLAHPEIRGATKGIGYHPYAGQPLGLAPQDPVRTPEDLVRRMRNELVNGVNLPQLEIYVTELGYPTQGAGPFVVIPSDVDRGEAFYRTASELTRSDCHVREYVPHTWLSLEQNPADQLHWMGIWNADTNATGKASGRRYGDVVRLLRGLTPIDPTIDPLVGPTVPICAGI
ncbi:MAG: hypothetical protein QOE35_8 [Actinomycetota bacterium]